MEFALHKDIDEIMGLYRSVVETVNKTDVKLGWDPEVYPNASFVEGAIDRHECCICREAGRIVAVAVVNHNVNKEYDDIDWDIKAPKEKIATIHALATAVDHRHGSVSDRFLKEIDEYCRQTGDLAIHLDVIDTNIPAYKLYMRNGYTEVACIKMFYEVVGTREFWMLERVL